MAKKRILWLFNHTSLRKFEIPLLVELGYEIYTPKIYDVEYGDRSASIDYSTDKTLSLPEDVIEVLNKTNLYRPLSEEILSIINEYFDIAFCMLTREPLKSLIYKFKGAILLHAFGLSDDYTYAMVLENLIGIQGLNQIEKIGKRFWFSQTYDNLAEIEPDVISRRAIYMPIGNGSSVPAKWVGGDKRILFIGPKIKSNVYYRKVYDDFCKEFGDLPHVIGGGQLIPVTDDDTVAGFLPKEEYIYNMTHLAAMYYHSQNPRHLHYHPLEAISYGMPLVFMAGGMFDHLGGKDLPGRCKTVKEARKKLKRLANGDKILANRIIKTQGVLLEQFTEDYCRPYWVKAMSKIEASLSCNENRFGKSKKRIAIILPAPYKGGVFDYTVRFCESFVRGIRDEHINCELTFVYPEDLFDTDSPEIVEFKKQGIKVQPFILELKDTVWLKRYLDIKGLGNLSCQYLNYPKTCVLKDGISNFSDFDFAFVMSDTSPKSYPLFLDIPHAVVAHDYIQHYVPGVISPDSNFVKLENQRNADYVLVTSKPSYLDALSYAGIEDDKIYLTPYMLSVSDKGICNIENEAINKDDSEYLLWSTNAMKHKNHIRALNALSQYYKNGGKLDVYVTGINTEFLKKDVSTQNGALDIPYINQVKEMIYSDPVMSRHIHIMGNMDKEKYLRLLSGARFLFVPGYGDNGNGSAFDAADVCVPVLSADYPAMRYLSEFMGVPMHFMDPFDINSMTDALVDMDNNCEEYKKCIPARDKLMKADYREAGKELFKVIKEISNI